MRKTDKIEQNMAKSSKKGENELTDKQKSARERDCAVVYGRAVRHPSVHQKPEGLVTEKMETFLDKERREKWIPEDEMEKLPDWKPSLGPAVKLAMVEGADHVSGFMKHVGKGEREKAVRALCRLVAKNGSWDADLIEAQVWRQLFDLQKEQGVVLLDQIHRMAKV